MEKIEIESEKIVYMLKELKDRGVWIMGVEGERNQIIGKGMKNEMRGGKKEEDFEEKDGEKKENNGEKEKKIQKEVSEKGNEVKEMNQMVIKEKVS